MSEEKPKEQMLGDVKVISRKGESVLVEFVDAHPHRVFVPADKVQDGKVAVDVLAAGVPYGLPWADLIEPRQITPDMVEGALRNAGIWTADQLRRNAAAAVSSLQSLYRVDLGVLLKAAQSYEDGGNE